MSLSPNVDTTVLVLSPLGKQVVSVELIPDEEDEVGLKLPLFLPRLKVEATSSSSTSFYLLLLVGQEGQGFPFWTLYAAAADIGSLRQGGPRLLLPDPGLVGVGKL